ncbi:hypothetical protein CH373_06875 [Leptospira perolatii]|uniref:Lipoprotein n=1 Tax=Leptospira perolatii TaxID=2023191 RepID=A0A2M9ZP62_9LEPT|nr:hypothetical protein [Leptospira perolatii]PJZ70655.1 hypothetical protein CH360_03735 [Leptospira perolatii]PJZ73866.1 hypothetical protein CH373_06875 [Leptospira perolatii]
MKKLSLFYLGATFLLLSNCSGSFALGDIGGRIRNPQLFESATIIRSSDYLELGESIGESSTFFLFGLWPVTNPLNVDYALSEAVRKIPGGKTIIRLKIWQETHLFFPVGTVSVLKVKGMVVGAAHEEVSPAPPRNQGSGTQNDGGISVGGKK